MDLGLKKLIAFFKKPLGLAWLFLALLLTGALWVLEVLSQQNFSLGRQTYVIEYHTEEEAVEPAQEETPPLETVAQPLSNPALEQALPQGADDQGAQQAAHPDKTVQVPEEYHAFLDPRLMQSTSWGILPIAQDKQNVCWRSYGCSYEDKGLPKISLVIQALGPATPELLDQLAALPKHVAIALLPYTPQLNQAIDRLRCGGYEVLLSIPMEPLNVEQQDAGPYTLMTGAPFIKNRDNLYWSLGQGVGYMGVVPYLGHRFISSRQDLKPILQDLHARGLLFFDPQSSATSIAGSVATELNMPYVISHLTIDSDLIPEKIDEALIMLETIAQKNGYAVGTLFSYPLSVQKVQAWATKLADRGYQIVPLSSLAFPDVKP